MGKNALTTSSIEGLVIAPLDIKRDDRGAVMHMLRSDSPLFERFGEVYFSSVKPGVVKAWKRHHVMIQNLAVPVGRIALVVYDDRAGSRTRGAIQRITLGDDCYGLVKIPPLLWYGFKGISSGDALIVNCASMTHDPGEVDRLDDADPSMVKLMPYFDA